MAMEDAARFIQKKFDWYQLVGKFLTKKKKGGKRGKGKKKKKWYALFFVSFLTSFISN